MKGVSEFVVVLIILIIVIASILAVWLFYNSMFVSTAASGATSSIGEVLSSCMKIDSASGNKIYLRNCGTGTVSNGSISVYMDEAPIAFTMNPSSIGKGQVAEIALNGLWGMSLGNHKIRVSSKAGEVERYVKVELLGSTVLDLEFDEGSETTAYDSSGNGKNGALVNGPTWSSGKYGSALSFNGLSGIGSANYVNVTNSENLNLQQLSIVLWINISGIPSLNQYPRIFSKTQGNNPVDGYEIWQVQQSSKIGMTIGNGSSQANGGAFQILSGSLTLNQWHYIVGTYDGSTMRLYVDGSLVNYATINQAVAVNSKTIIIGNGWWNGLAGYPSFNGTIDSVRIYNNVLTPDQTISLSLGELG